MSEKKDFRFSIVRKGVFSFLDFICQKIGWISSNRFSDEEDFPIIVGKKPNQKTFKSRRLLLSAFSDVFKAMFYGPLAEREKEVELPEDDPHAFEIMIDCMLTGEIRERTEQATIDVYELYKLVDKYQVIQVRRKCVDYLLINTTPEDFIRTFEMAAEFSDDLLRVRSFVCICKNATEVLKAKSFVNSKFSTVHLILSKDNINVSSEVDVYDAVSRWMKGKCRRKEGCKLKAAQEVHSLFSEIRFLTMTVAEFSEGPAKNKFLTENEKLSILTNIVSPNSVELPKICNRNRTKRRYQHAAQTKLSLTHKRKSVKPLKGQTSINIKQKSKVFSSDTCIYGVSFPLQCIGCHELVNLKLTIKNISKSLQITNSFWEELSGNITLQVEKSNSIFVGKGEECEISVSGECPGQKGLVRYCTKDCELDEFHASESGLHFHEIFMYRI